ncbi:MAG: choice-of-anchor tandem repeat GloVer-containing protein, partial [Thermosynechococcaceae cyanobacterium]
PVAGLIQGSNGSLYGTTPSGGTVGIGFGTVFKVGRFGNGFKTLVNFNTSNGLFTQAELLLASDGNFYGTTPSGGIGGTGGTVFRMKPNGTIKTLVTFTGTGGTGRTPIASLIQGNDGNFYGTTRVGGTFDKGTVFQMRPNGTLITLVNFDGANGRDPHAELIQAADGNFYGTTYQGGTNDKGTIFKLVLN